MLKAYFETPYAEIAKSDNGYFISRMYDEPVKVARGVVSRSADAGFLRHLPPRGRA